LGNFSFGDYFKQEAINFAWNLLTKDIGLAPEKLWITVYEDDNEAANIWLKEIGVPESQFSRIGAHDNFWSMGDTGPCGPCTEIFYDHGPDIPGGPPGSPDEDGDRFIEIWNLVFMQFNRSADGSMVPLPKPSVDTGMGLERLAAVLQGVHSNYEIDLFVNLIEAAASALKVDDLQTKSLRVVSDHIRSTAFMITDGVTPSNEGRGYVLRRIIRRAIRHGYQLGAREPFFHQLVGALDAEMGEAYPEFRRSAVTVEKVLKREEERFFETLDQGIRILDDEISHLSGNTIPGETVFKLYDTFGFPADLTNDVAREHNLQIDEAGFNVAMEAQRQRARSASRFVMGDTVVVENHQSTPFTGYSELEDRAETSALILDSQPVTKLGAGEEGIVILDKTPFYAESGGQVGDSGRLSGADGVFEVSDTQYLANKVIGHYGRVAMGSFQLNEPITASVDRNSRLATANNHSATHLLHAALQEVLGEHVQQKGSLVEADRLRFDFSHFGPVTAEEIEQVEFLVNQAIRRNDTVNVSTMALEEAREAGAAALFGEKYDDIVRVVKMGDFSLELCGGTHVSRTGDIGLLKVVTESGVAADVRRMEALTGVGALRYVDSQLSLLNGLSQQFKTPVNELAGRIGQLQRQNKELGQKVRDLQAQVATTGGGSDSNQSMPSLNGVAMVVSRHDGVDSKGMRTLMDQFKQKFDRAAIVLASVLDDKVTLIAGTSGEVSGVHCGELIKQISLTVNGKGGGRPDMAQGGGTDVGQTEEALELARNYIQSALQG
ncbi:MAG: alanyl-tRNA synthetase, partial [Parasphingorhabdus sp.]